MICAYYTVHPVPNQPEVCTRALGEWGEADAVLAEACDMPTSLSPSILTIPTH